MARRTAAESVPVPEWLVLGSFPLRDRAYGRWTQSGFPCESAFAPQLGESFAGARWVQCWTPHGRIEFNDPVLPFQQRAWCFAYAATYLRSPGKQRVRLLFGSDNGVVVWLNGQEVHRLECDGRVSMDTDVLDVTLRQGWNLLLVRAAQGAGSWGIRAHLGPAGRGGEPRIPFSLDRPSGRQFSGLRARRTGVIGQWSVGVARPMVTRGGQLAFAFHIELFNDSPRKASRVSVTIEDAAGRRLAQTSVGSLDAFTSSAAEAVVDAEESVVAILDSGDRSVSAVVRSSLGTTSVLLPPDAMSRLFCNVMTDLPVTLGPTSRNRCPVPEVFAGQPARVEVCVADEFDLTREHGWPELPVQEFTAQETTGETLEVVASPPPGVPGVGARIVFGEALVRPLAQRVRRMLGELGLNLDGTADDAAEGFRALFRGDVAAAWRCVGHIADRGAVAEPDRRHESVTLVGHAHVDMNWLWTYDETLQCTHDTFRQVLAFMDEFEDFHFSQSQPVLFEMIERFDPGMFEQIRRRVEDGRWELLGGFLTEGDTNMSSGEALARSLLLGQRSLRGRFGRIARVGWLPDNFGHVAQLPQMLRLGGMEFFYGHRCQPTRGPYVWVGVDGSRVLAYATTNYNGAVTPAGRDMPGYYNPKHRKAMWVYGVGDHGGGPTRADLNRVQAYRQMPGFPTLRCGTAESFFRSLETRADDYPEHRGELQFAFEGCYTSVARIKQANRDGENLMFAGEMLAAIAALYGEPYPHEPAREIWHALAFNQFHDILCGSATHDSNRESLARYDRAVSSARTLRFEALRRLTQRIDTQSCGQPVVVFNPLPRERSDIAEAEVFTYQRPPTAEIRRWWTHEYEPPRARDVGQGAYPSIHLVDHEGTEVPAQIVDGKYFPNGCRLKVQFPAQNVPACGYRVYHAFPTVPGPGADKDFKLRDTSVETPYFNVVIHPKTGHLVRVYDKRRKVEVLAKGEPGNVLKMYMEKPHGMSAWELGPVSTIHALDAADSVEWIERGPVRAAWQIKRSWGRSTFTQRIFVYRHVPRIDFELDVRWFELGGPDHDAPTLRVAFPLNARNGRFTCDTPFAAVERPRGGREVPAQKWIDLSGPRGGAALLNAGRYGHRCTGRVLETTLLRASYDPDKYPDQGPHLMRYALLPHAGTWDAAGVADAGLAFNVPFATLEAPPHPGELPPAHGFIQVEPSSVILSGVKRPEDGPGLIVRLYEIAGAPTDATIRLPRPVRHADRVNLLEDRLDGPTPPRAEGSSVAVALGAHEVCSLKINL